MTDIRLQKMDTDVKQGITFLASVFKLKAITEHTGIHQNYFGMVRSGYRLSEVKEFPARFIPLVNDFAQSKGEQLFQTRITADNPVEQLKALGTWLNLTYLFEQVMHWTSGQYHSRVSRKTSTVYGKFSAEQLSQINDAILMLAIKATSLHIASPVQDNTDNKVESDTPLQENPS